MKGRDLGERKSNRPGGGHPPGSRVEGASIVLQDPGVGGGGCGGTNALDLLDERYRPKYSSPIAGHKMRYEIDNLTTV